MVINDFYCYYPWLRLFTQSKTGAELREIGGVEAGKLQIRADFKLKMKILNKELIQSGVTIVVLIMVNVAGGQNCLAPFFIILIHQM